MQPGFYGKLPLLGDFVSRRLSPSFINAWDQWLQSSIAASREQLGGAWLDIYLTSPIWRFALSPGVCGELAWAGILMPSVDRVGRYFPLTLAASVSPNMLPYLFEFGRDWFDGLEHLALSGLENDFDMESFDAQLQAHKLPDVLAGPDDGQGFRERGAKGKFAFQADMASLRQTPVAFMGLTGCLLDSLLPLHSYWSTAGSERMQASLLLCEGLPPIDAFVSLLSGQWRQRGWAVRTRTIPAFATDGELAEDENTAPAELPQSGENGGGVWQWLSHGISVAGNRRKLNEDALIERADIGLWAVADGMGGHQAGDKASQAIVAALGATPARSELSDFAHDVEARLQQVNTDLRRLADTAVSGEIIGSTVVALLAVGHRCMALWAGDSRLYRLRAGKLEQISRDHSLLDDLYSQGLIAQEQLADAARCNVITRAVGADETLLLDSSKFEAEDGDIFLLCSDGLDKELGAREIERLLMSKDPRKSAEILIEQALAGEGRDNVTVIVVSARRQG